MVTTEYRASGSIPEVVLEARGITKVFPGLTALDNVDFKIYAGCVNALVGENGAGKSTLMKVLSGVYPQNAGEIFLAGQQVVFQNTKQAQDSGIAIIHQELNLFPYLSVAENIYLGREFTDRFGLVDYRRMLKESKSLLKRMELDIEPSQLVAHLRVGERQLVEIAKALSLNARVIIMDEPTSAISDKEVEILFRLISVLKDNGVAIVYISHKLDEVFQIGDLITIMRDGKTIISSRSLADFSQDDVIRMMVGRDLSSLQSRDSHLIDECMFEVKDISLADPQNPNSMLLDKVSFKVNRGEVLGIFGLMGAGRTELLETIFGVRGDVYTGEICVKGHRVSIKSPQEAIELGIGYVPEDRKEQGFIPKMAVGHNISLSSIKRCERNMLLQGDLEKALVLRYIERLNIRTLGFRQLAESLSGGNQQKVILAKWLATEPRILLLDEPTRGIDIGAKREIYHFINELTKQGVSIVMVSSELPEILALSDRIVVLSEGKKTGEFTKDQASEDIIMKAAIPRSLRVRQ